MKFILTFFLFFPSLTYAVTFTPIGNSPRFAPPAYSSYATANSSIKGAVTVGGKFAIATMNPRNAVALGRQLAKGSPYALLGLAALDFFQGDDDDWFKPPVKDGTIPTESPKSENQCSINVAPNAAQHLIGSSCEVDANAECQSLYPDTESVGGQDYFTGTTGELREQTPIFAKLYCLRTQHSFYNYQWNESPTEIYLGNLGFITEIQMTCPPDHNLLATHGVDSNGDGDIDKCHIPQDVIDYNPQIVSTGEMSTALGDKMFQTNQELTSWEPFKDYPSDSFLSPDYVSSYNQPNVSDTFDTYLKNVASGNYQSSDSNASNYVPAEMVTPTQAAIKGLEKGDPIVDPVSGEIANSNNKTEGAADPVVDPNAQNVVIQGSITVNVPEDDTISQTEYEQSNDKFFQEFDTAAQLENTKIQNSLTDLQTADTDFITSLTDDITNFTIPDFPTFESLFPALPFGSCSGFGVNTSIGGVQRMMTIDQHCAPYNLYIHPLLTWLLSVMTGLYVFHLASETLKGN